MSSTPDPPEHLFCVVPFAAIRDVMWNGLRKGIWLGRTPAEALALKSAAPGTLVRIAAQQMSQGGHGFIPLEKGWTTERVPPGYIAWGVRRPAR